MENRPWHTERWFVSPWNFSEETRNQLQFPTRIQIHDITLRDGEQQAGVVFTREDKIRIAEKLAEVGVHRIEAGTPAVSKEDAEAVQEIVRRKLGPQIFALARCRVEDIRQAVDCGVDGVIVEIPASEHMLRYAYRWPLEKAIELAVEATRFAHEQGVYVVFFPIDSTRSDIDWYLTLIEQVAAHGHMDALALVDTTGALSPHAVLFMVKAVRARIRDQPLEAHFHNDFGHATSNTIIALAAGAEVAHVTVSGLGERAGNAPLEEVVLSLLVQYGIDLGLKYEKLYELSRLVRALSGHVIPSNRPVVGDRLFHVESGIIVDWWRNCGEDHILELFPFRWDLVGQPPPRLILGKLSGTASVQMALERRAIHATEGQIAEILLRVKAASIHKKAELTEAEFDKIVESVLHGAETSPGGSSPKDR